MEILFINIVKSSGLIGMFYIAYYFLLRKETFFTANRGFLLVGLLTSLILPWIVFTTIVWVEPAPTNLDWSKIPVTTTIQQKSFEIDWNLVLAVTYIIGTVLFLAQFARDYYQLNRVLRGKNIYRQADHKFIDLEENIAPFSYFNTIVYNSSLYSESEMESILEHEKVHSEQYHTVDVLIARFFCILFWFNPFIWLYKKAILQNLEFIADSEATKNVSDKKAYQLTLLKITTHENCVGITNHFYQSLIKKRIIMLNKNQSNKLNFWKYALVLPALVTFMFLFQIEVIAQEKVAPKQENEKKTDSIYFNTKKNVASLKDKEIYIDGIKSTQDELTKLGGNEINNNETQSNKKELSLLNKKAVGKVDVNTSDNTVTITTKEVKPISENGKPIITISGALTDSKIRIAVNNPNITDKMTDQKYDENNEIGTLQEKVVKGFVLKSNEKSDKAYFQINGPVTLSPIIIMNGVKINSIASANEINPNAIKSISVLKGQMATYKYGESGKDGVIEITTNTDEPSKIIKKVVIGYPMHTSEKEKN